MAKSVVLCALQVYVAVDGTDGPIDDSAPFSLYWYSYNFYEPDVTYKVTLYCCNGKYCLGKRAISIWNVPRQCYF